MGGGGGGVENAYWCSLELNSSLELNTLAYLDVTFRLTCTLMHVYRWYYIKKKKASAKGTNTDTRTTDSYELID